MKLYSTTVHANGGRSGTVKSEDGVLNLPMGLPIPFTKKSNPEQLFAAGYAACFENAMRHVSKEHDVKLSEEGGVSATVSLHRKDGGFSLAVDMAVRFPDVPREKLQEVVDHAHRICPYSNATRGNIPVTIEIR
jgi:Ohr subfamily peroxiredoxin